MTIAPSPRPKRRGSARGLRFGDARRPEVQLARQREVEAVQLRAAGLTFAQIGVVLGVTYQGAHAAVARCRRRASVEIKLEAVLLDACRVERLLRAVLPRALAGKMGHIRAACGLIGLRQKLVQALATLRIQAGQV